MSPPVTGISSPVISLYKSLDNPADEHIKEMNIEDKSYQMRSANFITSELNFPYCSIPEGCVYPDISKNERMILKDEGIKYPNVDSCLTISCIFEHESKLGSHCVLIPNESQYEPNDIITNILNTTLRTGNPNKVFVLGDADPSDPRSFNQWKPSKFFREIRTSFDNMASLGIFFAARFKCEKVFFKFLQGDILLCPQRCVF